MLLVRAAPGGATATGCGGAAPARMRSSGLGSQGRASGGVAAGGLTLAGGVPGRVKWRAAPFWVGATGTAGVATGRVKPGGAAAGTGVLGSGGPS